MNKLVESRNLNKKIYILAISKNQIIMWFIKINTWEIPVLFLVDWYTEGHLDYRVAIKTLSFSFEYVV